MPSRLSRRLFLGQFLLTACGVKSLSSSGKKLVMGVVSFDKAEETLYRYTRFTTYLGTKIGVPIELEPTSNESKALEQIQQRDWSLAFASPGLAAIAIAKEQYRPIFPLRGINNLRSVLVVRKTSPIQDIQQLQGQTIALSQPGSATGYYLPIYNLYGLTLADILFASTPKVILDWVTEGKVSAGAVSVADFNLYTSQADQEELRVLHTDIHSVPVGVVLISSMVEPSLQEQIYQAMNQVSPVLAQEAGYVPNGPLPNYLYMLSVVERVQSISANVQKQPAYLF